MSFFENMEAIKIDSTFLKYLESDTIPMSTNSSFVEKKKSKLRILLDEVSSVDKTLSGKIHR